jgi:tRNA-dihydrouridine synthase
MSIGWKGDVLGVLETRRHYTNYFKGIKNFKSYRTAMVTANDAQEVFNAFDRVLEEVIDPAW